MRDSATRAAALASGVLGLLALATSAPAQTGERPYYARARAVFARLPPLDRNETSLELMATGDFTGLASGQLGPGLYDAIANFQGEHGLEPTGVPTPETRAALSAEGSRIFNSWGFEFLDHPVAEASLAVPMRFGLGQTRTPHGYELENAKRTLSVDFGFFPDSEMGLDEVFQNLARTGPGRDITFQMLRPTFLAVAGTSGGKSFYARWIVVPNGIAGFTLSWNRDAYPNAGRIAIVMANELYPRRMVEGGGREPSLAEAMPGDRDGADDPRAAGEVASSQTPLNDSMDTLSQNALRRMQEQRAERLRLAQAAEAQRAAMVQQRAAQVAAEQAVRNQMLDRLAAERLQKLQALGETRLADAARFVKENGSDPQVVPILVAITELKKVVSGRDAAAITARSDALSALLKADPVYAADAERRKIADAREKACNLAEAKRLLVIQRDFLVEASRRDPLGQATPRFMALVQQSRDPSAAADLDRAQTLVALIAEAIDTAGLQTSFALAKADAERASPTSKETDTACSG